jgi:peptide-methionine (R)-S-oxide reductase|tara:strand:- start:1031 stop:1522 length:492 start_codon:yes stop_codon:yes gene_type:complete
VKIKKISILTFAIALTSFFGMAQETQSKKKKNYQFEKTDKEWQSFLPKMSYLVLRKAATEYPFTGKYNNHKGEGTYLCAGCDSPLYKSDNKYESNCGWPSFDRSIKGSIEYDIDYKLGYARNELKCSKCGGHLGHVFNDGPKDTTGKRHCINSAALKFISNER